MRFLQNIRQRNGIFVFRRKVPHWLQPLINRRELVRSLGRCTPREARLKAKRLWIASERMFEMFVNFKRHEGEESDLISPDQLKLFVDAALALYRYNDQYVACVDADAKKLTSIESILVQLECWAKQARTDRAKHDISDLVNEIQELAEQLDIRIRRDSMSEKLIGHELLQAQARYHEEQADQLRAERGLPADLELRNLPLEELKDRLNHAWQQELGNQTSNSPDLLP